MRMKKRMFDQLYNQALKHKQEHGCGGVPYDHSDVLMALVSAGGCMKILEVGTGLGYTAACMARGNGNAHIDTIDQDASHIEIAKENWQQLNVVNSITTHFGKAEGILKILDREYDLIFFDGYVPQRKMLVEFERLLKNGGILVTANLFLRDQNGGKYMTELLDLRKWETVVFADTAVSIKQF